MALTESQIHRYARHLVMPAIGARGQVRLLAAAVRVDLGRERPASHAALAYLAAAGVGRLCVGGDLGGAVTAEEARTKLLFTTRDCGRSRLEAVTARVAALNPDVTVVADDRGPALAIDEGGDLGSSLIDGGRAASAAIAAIASPEPETR